MILRGRGWRRVTFFNRQGRMTSTKFVSPKELKQLSRVAGKWERDTLIANRWIPPQVLITW